MSKDFIEKRHGSSSLQEAVRQQKQLSCLTTSEVQEDTKIDFLKSYVNRKYFTDNEFLNYIKGVLKDDNFMSFIRYYRNPNPSSKLINNRIKEPLSRVFFSQDAFFNYKINGEKVVRPKEIDDDFEQELFKAILFRHNDIIIHDLEDVNTPFREFVSIDKVVSIDVKRYVINKIAYSACIERNGEKIYGFAYLDEYGYKFYNTDKVELINEPHDYGQCPATFIVKDSFANDEIVKQSIFSHVRADLEFYSFLVCLQKMLDINGAFPVVTMLETVNETDDDVDGKEGTPMSLEQINGQKSSEFRGDAKNKMDGVIQAGSVVRMNPIMKEDGALDMEAIKNYLVFHHVPVTLLKQIADRIKDLENDIIISVLGDYYEGNEASLSDKQAGRSYASKEDKLRWLSKELSFSRQASDEMMLSLKYGKDNVDADIFYGSDFFLESEASLYDKFEKLPNPIERKNILVRISQMRNLFNKDKAKRERILYSLIPYCCDKDFETAITRQIVSDEVFEYQTRFNYWVDMFESIYGDITSFWNNLGAKDSEKIDLINKLILDIIKTNNNNLKQVEQNGKETNNQA